MTADDLQINVRVNFNDNGKVTGRLYKLNRWSTPGWDPALGTHFLALHAESSTDGATVYGKCVPSQTGMDWTQADESGDYVFQVTENTEKVCFKSVKDGVETVAEYDLDLELDIV